MDYFSISLFVFNPYNFYERNEKRKIFFYFRFIQTYDLQRFFLRTRINKQTKWKFLSFLLEVGDLGTFLCEKKLVSRTTMSHSQRPNLSSAQAPQPSYVRTQLIKSGISPSRPPPQRDLFNSSNNMVQQTRTVTGLQNPPVQQPSSAS